MRGLTSPAMQGEALVSTLDPALGEHVARLLVGTDLDPDTAADVAAGALVAPGPVAAALRDGWASTERADFPGGGAVVDTLAACRARWVSGAAPAAEAEPATWRRWLDLPDESTDA